MAISGISAYAPLASFLLERARNTAPAREASADATAAERRNPVGPEASINVASGRNPEETIRRARIIQAAALAPLDPTSAERAVAAYASQMALQAQAELRRQLRTAELEAMRAPPDNDRISVYA
jgi:hypothetical protein